MDERGVRLPWEGRPPSESVVDHSCSMAALRNRGMSEPVLHSRISQGVSRLMSALTAQNGDMYRELTYVGRKSNNPGVVEGHKSIF